MNDPKTSSRKFVHVHHRIKFPLVLASACLALSSAALADVFTWQLPGAGSWALADNWSPAAVPNAVGASVAFNLNLSSASASVPLDSGIDGFTISSTTNSINVSGSTSRVLTLAAGVAGSYLTFTNSEGDAIIHAVAGANGSTTVVVPLVLSNTLNAVAEQTTSLSAAGAINLTAIMSGDGGFKKSGDGLATFGTGEKLYTGPTELNGGRMRISFAARPKTTSSFTINSGGQVNLINAAVYDFGSGPLNMNGTGPLTGPIAAFPGAMRNDRTAGPLTIEIANNVVLQSDTLIHVQTFTGNGGAATPGTSNVLRGAVSGPGKLMLTAPNSDFDQGCLVLQGNNSYAGGSLVRGGLLIAAGEGASFGTGDVTLDNTEAPSAVPRIRIVEGVINAIADTAKLTIKQGSANLGDGVNEVIGGLVLGSVGQPVGTYGSTASAAANKNDTYFSGTGIITVTESLVVPALNIVSVPPNVVISWTTNATGYSLEYVGALGETWQPDPSPVFTGTEYTVTELATTNRFYRLKK